MATQGREGAGPDKRRAAKSDTIRLCDRVRVVIPKVVVRVGYPKAVVDYLEIARTKYGAQLRHDMGDHLVERALHQIAYGLAKTDGFGGNERSLHMKDCPELLGHEFNVSGIRTVLTGTYYPPYEHRDMSGLPDYEPGGLTDRKAHRLVTGLCFYEIPAAHLWRM